MKIPADASDVHWVTVQRDGLRSNALPLAVDDLPEAIETEPNDTPAAAQAVAVPVVINGRIQAPGDADYFAFQAEAGQTLALEVNARRLGSPLDSILTLYDSTGRKLAEHDDPAPQAVPNALGTGVENDSGASIDPRDALLIHRADARLVHTFESAGKYVVRIGDVTDQGGQEYAYRLKIAPAEKDFALRVKTDVANVVQGDSALVAVNVFRRNGFDGPVRVEVQGLPAGFVASEATIPAGQNDGQLTLSAPADAATGLHTPRFLGKADVDGRVLRREGILLETVGQAFYIKHMLPTEGFLLHVGKNAFYTLSSDAPPGKELTIPRKGELKIVVKAARLESGQGPIGLAAAGPLPQGITVKPAQIGPAQGEATLSVTAAPERPPTPPSTSSSPARCASGRRRSFAPCRPFPSASWNRRRTAPRSVRNWRWPSRPCRTPASRRKASSWRGCSPGRMWSPASPVATYSMWPSRRRSPEPTPSGGPWPSRPAASRDWWRSPRFFPATNGSPICGRRSPRPRSRKPSC